MFTFLLSQRLWCVDDLLVFGYHTAIGISVLLIIPLISTPCVKKMKTNLIRLISSLFVSFFFLSVCFLQSAQEVSVPAEPTSSVQPVQRRSCTRVHNTYTSLGLAGCLFVSPSHSFLKICLLDCTSSATCVTTGSWCVEEMAQWAGSWML